MGMSNAERQRQYRQRHLTDVGGKGARLNLVVDSASKRTLERLSACYGITLREAVGLALDQAETGLLDRLSADERRAYYEGTLSLRRNGQQDDDADQQGQVDQCQQSDAEDDGHHPDDDAHQDDDGHHHQADAGADRDARIIAMHRAGESKRGIARSVGCSEGTVRNVIKRQQQAV